jgi:hypothetical protein
MSDTPKTPAEAARNAYFPHPAWKFNQLDEDSLASWVAVAQAAIDTYLAQVAEGLPQRQEIETLVTSIEGFELHREESQAIIDLFAERFAKLQAERDTLKATIAEAHALIDADASKIIRNAKDGYPDGRVPRELTLPERVNALCIYAADWKRWFEEYQHYVMEGRCKQHDDLIAERDELRRKLADEKSANLRNCQDAGRDIDDLNQRLIERTEGFMARLEEKTKRERYVPIEEHEAKMKVAVNALEDCEEYFKDRIDADHDGTRFVGNVESCKYNEVTEALTTLKGTK